MICTAFSQAEFNIFETNAAARRKARFYPLVSKDHSIVPNSYVVAFEDLTKAIGEDFQDGVFVIQNVMPAP